MMIQHDRYEYLKGYYKYTNWRCVVMNNNHNRISSFNHSKKGVWVILDTYRDSCFMYGIDVKDFLDICKKGNYCFFRDHYWGPTKYLIVQIVTELARLIGLVE